MNKNEAKMFDRLAQINRAEAARVRCPKHGPFGPNSRYIGRCIRCLGDEKRQAPETGEG